MRKNDVRKWIHAGLDLLPLLIIPIFGLAVRSDNNFTPIEVQQEKVDVVNFNQLFHNDLYYDRTWPDGASVTLDDYIVFSFVPSSGQVFNFDLFDTSYYRLNLLKGHKYYLRLNLLDGTLTNSLFMYPNYYTFNEIFTCESDVSTALHYYNNNQLDNFDVQFYFNAFDLTQMFGVGNEPSKTQFDIWYPDLNYVFNTGETQLLNTGIYRTYNDSDVGSQMVYTLYNSCDKYFNLNNVFNFNQIYDWLELNIFHGTAPMSIFIAWNIFLYEFLMDLIFLLYALFMFFVDFCSNLIDRFHTKCSGGK